MAGKKRQNAKMPKRKAAKKNRLASPRLGDRALINLKEMGYGG